VGLETPHQPLVRNCAPNLWRKGTYGICYVLSKLIQETASEFGPETAGDRGAVKSSGLCRMAGTSCFTLYDEGSRTEHSMLSGMGPVVFVSR
jgi:hypothetical protein